MGLTKTKIEEIECMTWDLLLESYGDKDVIPPVDINRIVTNSGLRIMQGKFFDSEIDGAYDKNNSIIYVSKNAPYVRQAFTVAHE